jgi:hypothetical protein
MEYKNYRIVGDRTYGMYIIKPHIGVLPVVLSGSFQKEQLAKDAIDRYSRTVEERDNKPAPIKKVKLTPRGEVNATEGDREG